MPTRPPRLCARCTAVHDGPCPQAQPWSTSRRPGSTRKWRRTRARVLAHQPVCAWPGCPRLSVICDHVLATAFGGTDAWSNLQGLCPVHDELKTQEEARRARLGMSPPPWPPPDPDDGWRA